MPFDAGLLKQAMAEKEVGARDLAAKAGLSPYTIFKLLNGERKDPSYSTIEAVAKALGKPIDAFGDMSTDVQSGPA